MNTRSDPRGELRAAFTQRELENARRSTDAGPVGFFLRVTLAVIFMYLIVIAYSMMGALGAVFVSVLFLVAFFIPVLMQSIRNRRNARASDSNGNPARLAPKLQQER